MYRNSEPNWMRILQTKRVYLFGAGKKGKKCADILKQYKILIEGFIDNDPKKKEIENCGSQIVSLEDYKLSCHFDNSIIVICSKYEREMKQQLLAEGIFNFISIDQIDFGGTINYYDENYFEWQKSMGEFGAIVSHRLFAPYVGENDTLVEFGSGGGYLLQTFNNKNKLGIEINDSARKYAESAGIISVKTSDVLQDEYADVIISSHVLEHVENPLGELRGLHRILKNGGKIVFYVPNESCETEYVKSEINNHLYTWNCLNIGNLFKAAGFFVLSVERIQEKWPNHWRDLSDELSEKLFDELCNIEGRTYGSNNCFIVAEK